jgi:hypothetical protein
MRLADKDHAFVLVERGQALRHHVVFALAPAKLHKRNLLRGHIVFQLGDKTAAHRAHQRRRRQRLTTVMFEEPHNARFGLQLRNVGVEVHAVDALDRQRHMPAEDFGYALCYHPHGSGRAVMPLEGAYTVQRSYLSSVIPKLIMNRRPEPQPPHASSV